MCIHLDAFATGGDLGFTMAAAVYDTNSTTSNQPVFLGVVGMDFKVEVRSRSCLGVQCKCTFIKQHVGFEVFTQVGSRSCWKVCVAT